MRKLTVLLNGLAAQSHADVKSGAITIDGGDLAKAAKPLEFAAGATAGAVRLRA